MRSTLVMLLAAATVGCAHFRVSPTGLSPANLPETRRVHAIAWGTLEPRIAPDNCQGQGMAQVTVRVTFMDVLVTVLSAGFWTPVTVEWTCAKTAPGGMG
jgi:hypothetical protein